MVHRWELLGPLRGTTFPAVDPPPRRLVEPTCPPTVSDGRHGAMLRVLTDHFSTDNVSARRDLPLGGICPVKIHREDLRIPFF